jgi:DNA-binding MarR family transcriptional regulator
LLWRPYIRHIQVPGTIRPLESSGELSDAVSSDPVVVADANWRAHGWDSGPYFRAALSIYRTNELIRLFDEAALAPHGLTRSRHEALAVLYFSRHGEMPLGRLSARLLVHPTSVTSTVDTLERLGHVQRVAHPTDRRTTLARITPKGRRAMEESCQLMADGSGGLWALTQHQAGRLFTILKQVRAAAGDLERGGEGRTADPVVGADRNWKSRGWDTGNHFRASLSVYRTDELIRQSSKEALDRHGLTSSRHEALAVIYFSRHGEMPLGRLGARLLVHPTSVTSTVDTLERLGHVARVAHPTDRRTTLARITPKGRRAIEASNRDMVAARFGLGALDEARADALFSILGKVRREGAEPTTSAATARSARSAGA